MSTNKLQQQRIQLQGLLSRLPAFASDYLYSIQNSTTILTQIAYLSDIEAFLGYFCDVTTAKPKVSELVPSDLILCDRRMFDEYLNYLRHYEKDGVEYTNDTASLKRKLAAIRSLTTYLYNEGLLPENAITKVNNPKLRKKEVSRLSDEETEQLFAAVEGGFGSTHEQKYLQKTRSRDLAILATLLSTGIRISELVGINLNDVDEKTSSIRILRKGKKEGIVYYSDEAAEFLERYISERKVLPAKESDENALFLSLQQTRMTVRAVQIMIKKYAAAAIPLRRVFPHLLRKTYGSRMYDETEDVYLVAKLLGHNSVETTAKHYISSERELSGVRNRVSLRGEEEKEGKE